MIITGLELKQKKGRENCGAINTDMYEYLEHENGSSEATRIPTQDEIAEQEKQSRIAELITLIEKKRIRGYEVSSEIAELEELDPIL